MRAGALRSGTESAGDPKPKNETRRKLNPATGLWSSERKGERRTNAEEGTQRGEDSVRATPGRKGQEGGRPVPGNGRFAADVLHVEAALRGAGAERATGTAATARGEPQAEGFGGGPEPGQAHIARGAVKKSLRPAVRRELVEEVRRSYELSE